jgi:hypothetical protein
MERRHPSYRPAVRSKEIDAIWEFEKKTRKEKKRIEGIDPNLQPAHTTFGGVSLSPTTLPARASAPFLLLLIFPSSAMLPSGWRDGEEDSDRMGRSFRNRG